MLNFGSASPTFAAALADMTVSDALETISKALGVWAQQTRAENLAGLFSKNRLTEDLLLPLFRLVFEAPRLQNLNRNSPNSAYVDLADDRARLAIQVTTDRTATKITTTLKNFLDHRYQKRYKRLVFFLLTPNAPHYAAVSRKAWQQITGHASLDSIRRQDIRRLRVSFVWSRTAAHADLRDSRHHFAEHHRRSVH
jgi:hypothetical protein